MIKYVLMDLDDTLFDFHKCEAIAVAKTMAGFGVEPTDERVKRYSEINDLHWKRLERKEITKAQVVLGRFQMFLAEQGIEGNPEEWQNTYMQNLAKEQYFLPGAMDLLNELKGKYDLYIISNGTLFVQRGRIEKSGIARYFRRIFISGDIGINKPAKEFFDYCFDRIPNFNKEEAILLGDSLTSDILGGNNSGLRTVWFNSQKIPPREDIVPTYEIKTLADFPKLLKTL